MTPESLIGAFDLLDRWRLMLLQMQGQPIPEPPALPGHKHCAPRITEADPGAERYQRELQAARIWRELADDCSGHPD